MTSQAAPPLSPEALVTFLASLHENGFAVTPQQQIAARNILAALASQDQLPKTARELASYLSPILCTTPAEQTQFYELCEGWLPAEKGSAMVWRQRSLGLSERRKPARAWILFAVLVAGMAGAAWYVQRQLQVEPLPPLKLGPPAADVTGPPWARPVPAPVAFGGIVRDPEGRP